MSDNFSMRALKTNKAFSDLFDLCELLNCEPLEVVERVKELREDRATIIRQFVAEVNAAAEADMLNGNPITGAHHRALEAALARLEGAE